MKAKLLALAVGSTLLLFGLPLQVHGDGFPSFHPGYPPPQNWNGSVFDLIQDYPETAPKEEKFPWGKTSPSAQPFIYAKKLLAYALEGNINKTGAWRPESNSVRRWYHAPWMHAGCNGREFINGLTRERPSRPFELHHKQNEWHDNWAISVYNKYGGWVLGQVWADPTNPQADRASFPEGTVAVKLLFTTATTDQVPYLANGVTLQAHTYRNFNQNPCSIAWEKRPRQFREMRLLQLDIAVRDSEAKETGWVFMTFIYDGGNLSPRKWDRLVPVGVSWGNDEKVVEGMNTSGAFANHDLKQNILNPELLKEPNGRNAYIAHAGLGGRLNGPVDNPVSSCMSCHGRAVSPGTRRVAPEAQSPENVTEDDFAEYFVNVPWGNDTFEEKGILYTRLDYSLQLAFGLRSFHMCRARQGELEGCGTTKSPTTVEDTARTAPSERDTEMRLFPMSVISRGEDLER